MILAAGRGERMRPLSDQTPKPLLSAGGKPLIVWQLERLRSAGFLDVVINLAHLGEQIKSSLGNGSSWGLSIQYSHEPHGALESAGGIVQALTLLGNEPFLVVNGDIYYDWDPAQARVIALGGKLAHIWLVDNPAHHPTGDFCLQQGAVLNIDTPVAASAQPLTFSGIGVYRPELFAGLVSGQSAKLAPLLRQAAAQGCLRGERLHGRWLDVGTPQRLVLLDAELRQDGCNGLPAR